MGTPKLLQKCEEVPPSFGDIMVTQSGEFKALKKFAFSILVVTAVDVFFKREAASDQLTEHMSKAMTTAFTYLNNFIDIKIDASTDREDVWKKSQAVTDEINAALGKVEALLGAADSEPRFFKCPFKATFCTELVTKLRTLQFDTMCLARRSQFPAPGIINMLSEMKSFQAVQQDLKQTIKDAEVVASKVLTYEGFGAMDPEEFMGILDQGSTATLEGVDDLVKEIASKLPNEPDDCPLEESALSRMCVVAEMLERVTLDVHEILQLAVINM